jgi:hypothetical protein
MALREGVVGIPDGNRPEFYEIEIGDNWYYLHLPSRIAGVYLIAAARRATAAKKGALSLVTGRLSLVS